MCGESKDPFEMLGLARRFDLKRAEIERAYLERAPAMHPDTGGGGGSQIDSLNRARQDLSDPETRANLLVGLWGGPTREQDRSLPDGFLLEMMDVREQMERDAPDPAATAEWTRWADRQREEHIAGAGKVFEVVEREGPTPERLKAIRTRLNAWRYVERMLEQTSAGSGER